MHSKVYIASRNPVKIQATQSAFRQTFPNLDFNFEGVSAPSGVSDQPMTDSETLHGAQNRVDYIQSNFPDADYWVGIEGGIERMEEDMGAFAWVVIHDATQKGKARTCTFFLPKKVVELIDQGMELGEADDVVFGQSNSKHSSGAVGLLTDGQMDRAGLYQPAVLLALIPFLKKELY